jgi:hypothetical protein
MPSAIRALLVGLPAVLFVVFCPQRTPAQPATATITVPTTGAARVLNLSWRIDTVIGLHPGDLDDSTDDYETRLVLFDDGQVAQLAGVVNTARFLPAPPGANGDFRWAFEFQDNQMRWTDDIYVDVFGRVVSYDGRLFTPPPGWLNQMLDVLCWQDRPEKFRQHHPQRY